MVSAAQTGDTAAFDHLILRHQERIYALSYHMLGNAEDAADAQQEAFVRAWTKIRGFRQQASFSTWLYRIAVNVCIATRQRRRPLADSEPERNVQDAPSDCEARLVNSVVVRQLLAEIPVRQRTLLVLREIDGMSIDEIANIVGSSAEAVRKQLWRVRRLFGKRLQQQLTEDES